jgi:hypothetical protein
MAGKAAKRFGSERSDMHTKARAKMKNISENTSVT